jgi:2-polyprenyl-6-methoxyphenol hydroxylase-like FAD-dependent oxidoreductase
MDPSLPRIAILGAGPVGLDAALAAAEAGHPFDLYEAGDGVATAVRSWAHVRLFSPWSMNVSPRMRRALARAGREVPAGDACPTGSELLEEVLKPVGALESVASRLHLGTRVKAVGREGLLKHEAIGSPRRAHHPFRILVETRGEAGRAATGERVEHADVVLDCTGTWSNPNPLGEGGIPAPGEAAARDHVVRELPDVHGEPSRWQGKRVLLVGAGHSAQTAAAALAELAGRESGGGEERGGLEVVWAVRDEAPDWGAVQDDPLPERERLARRAGELAAGASSAVEVRTGVAVKAVRADDPPGRVTVLLGGDDGSTSPVVVDRILALTGSVGDASLYRQLQVHECYATSGPMKLSAALLGAGSGADCLAQDSHGPETLVNPEPNFFLLGSKSYGRNSTFLLRVGWAQVDDVFELIGEEGASA